MWTPQNASACTTLFDHIISYFAIEIVRDGTTVLASTRQPTNMDSPCVEYRLIKADILGNFPPIVYAGMVHEFTITLSQPTKMLRVMLNTTSPWITFEPDRFYFSNFDST